MLHLTNFDLNKNQLLNAVVQNLASAPATPAEGQLYYNTTDDKLYYRSSGGWVAIEASAGSYTLPVATSSVLGGVKDGTGVTIAGDGTLSVDYGSSAGTAVQGNDARVTADQVAGTASIRTLGTGAQQASAGNHTHTALGDLTITGNLTVNGTTTTINTTEMVVSDNKITLNNDVTGTPTEDAGVIVERGTSANVEIEWDETADAWQITNDGTDYHAIARKFVQAIGGATSVVVTHNLNTRDIVATLRTTASPYDIVVTDIEFTTLDTCTVYFAVAPSAGAYTLTLVG